MAAVAAHPQLVGNAFVSQYYNVLHHSQHVVHRFYTDVSCLTRAECGPEGPVETVYSQNGIYDKIMSVDYSELRAEIKTVDCQDSYSGSVLVMVTGSLSTKAQRRRDFVQTFFLAPQEKGYYVLNDVFRYLDDPQAVKPSMNAVQESAPAPPAAPVANPDERHDDPNESVLAVAEEEIAPEEVYDVPDVEEEAEVEAAPEIEQPSEATRTPLTSSEVEAMPSADEGQGDHPKKSYASILGGPVAQKPPAPAVIEKPMASPSPQATPVSAPAPPPSMDHTEEPENADANGRSVYVKNLAVTITDSQLEEALHRFGAVKSVSIKRPQNFSYAFVEFEEVSAARAAVEASPIQIDGKTVHIEEKRPMGSRSFRGRGRGRAEGNRGGRNSGGYYAGGGRGGNSNSAAGRGSYSSEAGGSGRGGRGGGYRGSYHSNSNNNSNHNINNNSSSDERYQPQQQQRYENQSQNGGGAQAHQQSSARRKHYRAPFSRSSSGAASGAAAAAAAPSSAVTAP